MSSDGVGAPDPGTDSDGYRVPPPRPLDDGRAWYAPEILAQRTVHPGVVATIRERDGELRSETREPELSAPGERALARVCEYFEGAELRRPLLMEPARRSLSCADSSDGVERRGGPPLGEYTDDENKRPIAAESDRKGSTVVRTRPGRWSRPRN